MIDFWKIREKEGGWVEETVSGGRGGEGERGGNVLFLGGEESSAL